MDGFVKMTRELVEIVFLAASLYKETIILMIPEEFGKSVKFLWRGGVGIANPLGYIMAAAYFFGLEFGFGEDVCSLVGYGYAVIDLLHGLVSFSQSEEDKAAEEQSISNTASQEAKDAAAKAAVDSASWALKGVDLLIKKQTIIYLIDLEKVINNLVKLNKSLKYM